MHFHVLLREYILVSENLIVIHPKFNGNFHYYVIVFAIESACIIFLGEKFSNKE